MHEGAKALLHQRQPGRPGSSSRSSWRPPAFPRRRSTCSAERCRAGATLASARGAVVHEERRRPLDRARRLVGLSRFVLVLVVAYLPAGQRTPAGWIPFIFLAVVLLGFCTWEGGLIGIQDPNHNFTRFEQALKDGKHIFFVDLEPGQEAILARVLKTPRASRLGRRGTSTPHWLSPSGRPFAE